MEMVLKGISQTHVVSILRASIKIIRLPERHMRVGNNSGIVFVVEAVGMWQQAV
jgi:hypothetical protein